MAGRKGEKHWRDAVMIAVNETVDGDPDGRKKLRAIADKVVELALDGDMQAIKEIGDRMDGKAPISADVTSGGKEIKMPSQIILKAASADSGD